VLATDTYETIRPVLSALRRQQCVGRIEPVIVLPTDAQRGIRDDELRTFARAQIVPLQEISSLALARAAGVRAASAPIVFIGETHTYPQPGWAEALLARFEEPWAAVVPGIDNANPTCAVSWASYLFDYGSWGTNRAAGEMSDPLIYNTAYRRAALVSLGDRLAEALDPNEEILWPRLWAMGHRAAFAPNARILHLNVGTVNRLLAEKFSVGVVLGMRRAARWTWRRRMLYILASPLIPLVLLTRVARGVRRSPPGRLPVGTIPALVLTAAAKAAGELVGYAGAKLPSAEARLMDIEIRKVRYAGRRD
jgi:hypothetical protein